MNVVDLHPEELLDKDARGELSADERVRLDAHLARCAACRAEQVLRADFAAELDGEDRDSAIINLVQGALAVPRPEQAAPEPAPRPQIAAKKSGPLDTMPELDVVPGLRRRPRRTAAFLLVAAAVLAASAAGATGLTGTVWRSIRGNSQEATHASATSPLPMPVGPSRSTGARPSAIAPTAVLTASTPEPAAAPAPAPLPEPVPKLPPASPRAVPAPARVATTSPAVPSAAPVASTAAGLFEAANTARRTGDTNGALAGYDALERQFPSSPEARVAKATTARLLLDRGDAAGALRRFDAYLASGSTELREEAMAGRATALERLGRDEEESRAWAALLATYPRTPYAAHARARVGRSLPQ